MHTDLFRYPRAVCLLLVMLLTGCGFHLRGQAQLPPAMAVTYIKTENPHSPLTRALRSALEASGVEVTTEPEAATATVEIIDETFRRRTLAVGSRGEERDYELRHQVRYAVSLADGSRPIPRGTIDTSRNLLYDETDVLGRAEGEEMAIRDMSSDLAWSIIRRLQTALPARS